MSEILNEASAFLQYVKESLRNVYQLLLNADVDWSLVALAALLGGMIAAAVVYFFGTRPAARQAAEAGAARAAGAEALAAAHAHIAAMGRYETEARELRARLDQAEREKSVALGNLEAQDKAYAARLDELRAAEERIGTQFKSIAAETLNSNSTRFLQLVSERFETHNKGAAADLAKRQTAIEALVKPLTENLTKFEGKIGEIEKARENAYAAINTQVMELRRTNEGLRGETGRLVQALRAPKTRGRWGELQLRQVFEMAGMVEHVDFYQEKTVGNDDGGTLRPDAVVRMPGGKTIVIDAKTPLDAYLDLIEAIEPETQQAALTRHASQVRAQVNNLSGKEYWRRLDGSPDFVVMFIPGEAIYSAAMQTDPGLFEDAFQKRVLIATPTTTIALVKAIAYGWQQEKLAANAKEVRDTAVQLYERLKVVGDNMGKLGRTLRQSVDNYNRTVGSFEGRVLPAARRFESLGVAAADTSLESPPPIETEPRPLSAPEFQPAADNADSADNEEADPPPV